MGEGKNVEKRGKKSKKMKKVLDKRGIEWYSIKAVASGGPGERVSEKKNLKKMKKVLDKLRKL